MNSEGNLYKLALTLLAGTLGLNVAQGSMTATDLGLGISEDKSANVHGSWDREEDSAAQKTPDITQFYEQINLLIAENAALRRIIVEAVRKQYYDEQKIQDQNRVNQALELRIQSNEAEIINAMEIIQMQLLIIQHLEDITDLKGAQIERYEGQRTYVERICNWIKSWLE
ncbi:MAG: hypothetical protein LBJ92_02580 [Holosporales bacterium]|jgi:hypothetical protein|nr:hypothetical protein [Holosporales bacterium]